jgi:hypothetical protein
MALTKQQTDTYNGFAIPLEPDTDLGLAMLIAEDEDGHYEPVASASTINEAKSLAKSDMLNRMRSVERDEHPGICPTCYKLWARGANGAYRLALEIEA